MLSSPALWVYWWVGWIQSHTCNTHDVSIHHRPKKQASSGFWPVNSQKENTEYMIRTSEWVDIRLCGCWEISLHLLTLCLGADIFFFFFLNRCFSSIHRLNKKFWMWAHEKQLPGFRAVLLACSCLISVFDDAVGSDEQMGFKRLFSQTGYRWCVGPLSGAGIKWCSSTPRCSLNSPQGGVLDGRPEEEEVVLECVQGRIVTRAAPSLPADIISFSTSLIMRLNQPFSQLSCLNQSLPVVQHLVLTPRYSTL